MAIVFANVQNLLQETIPIPEGDQMLRKLGRNAMIGFCSSLVSDTVSNSIRVIKTTKQTHATPITYRETVKLVMRDDGLIGLMGRGLKIRLLANGLQGMLFTVVWKGLEAEWIKREDENEK